jgi:hypothetical protein
VTEGGGGVGRGRKKSVLHIVMMAWVRDERWEVGSGRGIQFEGVERESGGAMKSSVSRRKCSVAKQHKMCGEMLKDVSDDGRIYIGQ